MSSFLVQYGVGAWLGRFLGKGDLVVRHGDRVVVRTARGAELGTVFVELDAENPNGFEVPAGDLLRGASEHDESLFQTRRIESNQILEEAQRRSNELNLPLLFLDSEILLDGTLAILQAIHQAECDATSLFEELSERFQIRVVLQDLTAKASPPPTSGCGKPGCGSNGGCSSCGSEGGGCSTGCSRGKVQSPQELTHYFRRLREQMEASHDRIPLS